MSSETPTPRPAPSPAMATNDDRSDIAPADLAAVKVRSERRSERRKLRRRVRAARRNARLVYGRGRLFPRTLAGVACLALVVAVAVGATAAVCIAVFQTRFDDAMRNVNAELDRRAPLLAEAAAGEPGQARSAGSTDVVIRTGDGDSATTGAGLAVISDGDRTFWLTSLDAVRAATVAPQPPIRISGQFGEANGSLWSWDDKTGLALVEASVPKLVTRPWLAAGTALVDGTAVVVLTPPTINNPASSLPATVSGYDGTSRFRVHPGPGASAPAGTPVLTTDGSALGVVVGSDGSELIVAPTSSACSKVISCNR